MKPGGILAVEDLGIYPNRYQHFTDDPEINTTADSLFDLLEEGRHTSFLSTYENPVLFEQVGLIDVRASSCSSYKQGGSDEGKVWHLTMAQLKPLLVNKQGVDEALYENVRNLHLDKSTRWWGANHVMTIGVKPL